MKNLLLILLMIVLASPTFGQSKISRQLADFDQLEVRGAFDIYLKPGATNAIDIEAKGVEPDEITTEVKGNKLIIALDKNNYGRSKRSILYLTYSQLNRIEWSGAGELWTQSALIGDKLELLVTGAGKVVMQLSVKTLHVNMSGAGKVELSGRVTSQHIQMNGVGAFEGTELQSETANVQHNGVGTVRVNVTKVLEANASGIGSILYTGHPKDIKSHDSGFLGKVRPM
ncbi:MAG: head GIN domain-containing protein [Bacteroidota bacterium]